MAEEEPEEGAELEEKAKPAGSPFRYLFLILVNQDTESSFGESIYQPPT